MIFTERMDMIMIWIWTDQIKVFIYFSSFDFVFCFFFTARNPLQGSIFQRYIILKIPKNLLKIKKYCTKIRTEFKPSHSLCIIFLD